MTYQMPILIMGGADKEEKVRYTKYVHEQNGKHTILDYKMVDMQFNGKPFVQELIDKYKQSEFFNPIYIAGPESIYKGRVDCNIIDTDSSLGENIHKSLEYIMKKHGKDIQCGISFGDIMPTVEDITKLMQELEPYLESDFIYEIVERPVDIGNSNWKPGYTFIDRLDQKKKYLPGHLGIVRPQNLRLGLSYQLVSSFYATKNKSVGTKIAYTLSHLNRIMPYLFGVVEALPFALLGQIRFSQRKLSISEAERKLNHVFINLQHRLKEKDKHVHVQPTKILSLAKDIDTKEELDELIKSQKTP